MRLGFRLSAPSYNSNKNYAITKKNDDGCYQSSYQKNNFEWRIDNIQTAHTTKQPHIDFAPDISCDGGFPQLNGNQPEDQQDKIFTGKYERCP